MTSPARLFGPDYDKAHGQAAEDLEKAIRKIVNVEAGDAYWHGYDDGREEMQAKSMTAEELEAYLSDRGYRMTKKQARFIAKFFYVVERPMDPLKKKGGNV